ncbi:Gfo/Idh/MocA family oxidoreductase [Streptomyces sp. NBC_01298]|uniref:Gfo/Idh/MocA family protein n=1 Tax=Streptomyces sp. NBC_01298 TaxID=2903817 RepID=UPI002E158302|nr:Gfo/Idh/MocA family oxidoreductase [Streptomyces sp. NBC_01298]
MTQIAVLGAGRIGSLHAANLLAADPGLDLVIHDPDTGAAKDLADRIGARVAHSVADALAVRDGLVVATPSHTHPDLIAEGVERGLAVFCEKPVATALAEARRVTTLVRRTGARVQIGFQRRRDPGYVRLRAAVAAGDLGDVLMVRATAFDKEPPPASYLAVSGGMAADCVVHDLDAVPWLAGQRITEVYADGAVLTEGPYAELHDHDVLTVLLTLEDGARGVLTASRTDPHGYDHRVELLGTKGSAAAGLTDRTPLALLDGAQRAPAPADGYRGFLDRFAPAYAAEMADFLRLCRGSGENPCPPEAALDAMRAVAAVQVSLREGRRVALDEID